MMHFNLINPSDPYTVQAPDLEIAAIVCALLGEGKYSLEQISGDRSAMVPFFLFGGHDEWFTKQFGRDFKATLNHVATARRGELIKSLTSVHLGTPADKLKFDELAAQCPDEEAVMALLHEHHDGKRSSANDIGRLAWSMAHHLADTPPSPAVPATVQ